MLIVERSELADEVLQEAYLAIWKCASLYNPQISAPMTWMLTIVRNKAFDVFNHGKSQERMWLAHSLEPLVDSEDAKTPDSHMENKQSSEALSIVLGKLLRPHQEIFKCIYFHGMSVPEAADTLNLPLGTAKTWVRRGLAEMRLSYAQQ